MSVDLETVNQIAADVVQLIAARWSNVAITRPDIVMNALVRASKIVPTLIDSKLPYKMQEAKPVAPKEVPAAEDFS